MRQLKRSSSTTSSASASLKSTSTPARRVRTKSKVVFDALSSPFKGRSVGSSQDEELVDPTSIVQSKGRSKADRDRETQRRKERLDVDKKDAALKAQRLEGVQHDRDRLAHLVKFLHVTQEGTGDQSGIDVTSLQNVEMVPITVAQVMAQQLDDPKDGHRVKDEMIEAIKEKLQHTLKTSDRFMQQTTLDRAGDYARGFRDGQASVTGLTGPAVSEESMTHQASLAPVKELLNQSWIRIMELQGLLGLKQTAMDEL